MMTDPISDLLSRIRNALMVRHAEVNVLPSRMGERILGILKRSGLIEDYTTGDKGLLVKLKYDQTGAPVIEGLKRASRPGLRVYSAHDEIPSVRGGLGITIISTSHGVMTGSEAKKLGVGGELICTAW